MLFIEEMSVMKKVIQFVVAVVMLSSCESMFQYSPYEVRLDEDLRELNKRNIEKLQTVHARDSFNFILIGDSQRSLDEVTEFVNEVNKMKDVDFVVLAGDITHFGMSQEYKWVHERLSKLRIPYIAVIGNHDMLANGRHIYKKMYGDENFAFTHSNARFICLNTNAAEVGRDGSIPDLNWLAKELNTGKSYKHVFVISHVPPFDTDFDPQLESQYATLLAANNKVRMSLHGHRHTFEMRTPYEDGLKYLVVGSQQKRNYALISIRGDDYSFEERYF